MTLRTPRRRISPRTKRRYRAIRKFLQRAIGSASQQHIKINSGIALNVSSLKHKIFGLDRKPSEASKGCDCQNSGSEDCTRKDSASTLITEIVKEPEQYREQLTSSANCLQNTQQDFNHFSDSGTALTETDDNYQRIDYEAQPETMVIPDRVSVSLYDRNNTGSKKEKSRRKLNVGTSHALLRTPSITTYDNRVNAYSTTSVEIAGPSLDRHRRARRGVRRPSRRNCTKNEHTYYFLENELNYKNSRKTEIGSPAKHNSKERQLTRTESPCKYLIQDRPTQRSESPAKYQNQERFKSRPESPTKQRNQDRPTQRTESPSKFQKQERLKPRSESPIKQRNQDRSKQKSKSRIPEGALDHNFIADLIERQYSPVCLFGRRTSEISQFTQPICRDRVPPEQNNTYLHCDPDISSCYQENFGKAKYNQNNYLNNKRSVCDARLYGNKRRSRSRHQKNVNAYDSKYYDIIPVKEKASPKSRRKFVEDNLFVNGRSAYYVEVPPSPRSNRPRLNLRAQYYDQYDDCSTHVPPVRKARSPAKVRMVYLPVETDVTTDTQEQQVMDQVRTRPMFSKHCEQELQVPPTNKIYETHNDLQENIGISDPLISPSQGAVEKTDKTLGEIKDLLQTFLAEIKISTMSKTDHSESKNESIQASEPMTPATAIGPVSNQNRIQNFNPMNNTVPGSVPSPMSTSYITNPCCPLLPVCPINMQHHVSCIMPTPSFTCNACINNCARNVHKTAEDVHYKENNEIDDLIKEIHKLVAHKEPRESQFPVNMEGLNARINEFNPSGCVNSQVQRQDAQVSTTKMRCFSRSCEAIGSILTPAGTPTPTVSYSDTVLERMSLNPLDNSSSNENKSKEMKVKQRFNLLLKTLGLLKKKKKKPKSTLEVISESDNLAFTEPYRPFRSDVTNCMMYDQEYMTPPPHSGHHSPCHYCPYGDHELDLHKHHQYEKRIYDRYATNEPNAQGFSRRLSPVRYDRGRGHSPSAPPYSSSYVSRPYNVHGAEGPLCLKEIEVKSTATQSEVRKLSFFQKLAKKTQQNAPRPRIQTNASPQPPPQPQPQPQQQPLKKRQSFFHRRNGTVQQQAAAPQERPSKLNTWKYQLKLQQDLANADKHIQNTLIQRVFNKRNPFSLRNPIMQTLLGKDTQFDQQHHKFSAFKPKIMF